MYYGKSLHTSLWTIREPEERLKFLVENVEGITKLKEFGNYMNKILTIDMLFLNEDRHTHNLAVLMNDKNEFMYCPIFDNGASLLSDTELDYPLEEDTYKLIDKVKSKTFIESFEEQTELSEKLYGMNIHFNFNKKDIEDILESEDAKIYSKEERNRVRQYFLNK